MKRYFGFFSGANGMSGRFEMANIVIKDLQENVELDRKAMRAITGGRSTQRMGMHAYHSTYFQKPASFNDLRLVPGMMTSNDRW